MVSPRTSRVRFTIYSSQRQTFLPDTNNPPPAVWLFLARPLWTLTIGFVIRDFIGVRRMHAAETNRSVPDATGTLLVVWHSLRERFANHRSSDRPTDRPTGASRSNLPCALRFRRPLSHANASFVRPPRSDASVQPPGRGPARPARSRSRQVRSTHSRRRSTRATQPASAPCLVSRRRRTTQA